MTTMPEQQDEDSADSPTTSRRFGKPKMFNINFRRQTSNEYGRKSDGNEKGDGDTVKTRLLSAWNNVKFGKVSSNIKNMVSTLFYVLYNFLSKNLSKNVW
jgi:hypothetical protein